MQLALSAAASITWILNRMHAEVLPFHASLTVVPYQRKDDRTDNFHSEIYSSGNTFNTSELPLTLELCGTLFKPLNFSLSVSLSYCLTQPLSARLLVLTCLSSPSPLSLAVLPSYTGCTSTHKNVKQKIPNPIFLCSHAQPTSQPPSAYSPPIHAGAVTRPSIFLMF
jgi:hypothetical protein